MIQKYGTAEWRGGLRDGQGAVSTETGVLADQNYTFAKRFGDEKGTNPEELIGAAHAACFSMALSATLERAGFKASDIDSKSTVSLEFVNDAPTITRIHLDVAAEVPGIDGDKFQELADDAKRNCPVSRVLSGADITMSARLA